MIISVKAAIGNMRRMEDCPSRPDMNKSLTINVCTVKVGFGTYWRIMQSLRRTLVEHVDVENVDGDLIIKSLPDSKLKFTYTLYPQGGA